MIEHRVPLSNLVDATEFPLVDSGSHRRCAAAAVAPVAPSFVLLLPLVYLFNRTKERRYEHTLVVGTSDVMNVMCRAEITKSPVYQSIT